MKNITLSADEKLIQEARDRAQREQTTLNELFRAWLARYVAGSRGDVAYNELMEKLSYARPGRRFSRDELNER